MGVLSNWVGYDFDVGRFVTGVSEAGAAWAIHGLDDKAQEKRARLVDLREGFTGCNS